MANKIPIVGDESACSRHLIALWPAQPVFCLARADLPGAYRNRSWPLGRPRPSGTARVDSGHDYRQDVEVGW